MKFVAPALFGLSLLSAAPAFAATPPPAAPVTAAAASPAHVKAVQDLLGAMHFENELRSVAGRSRYASVAQRDAVFAKIDKTPPADIYRRLAPAVARIISADTAAEMTRFYSTPYGKQVIHRKYNSGPQIAMPGMTAAVSPEEKKERKRPAYVQASKELAAAEPALQHEAFKLLQEINKEKR